ncbi:MAG TPA: flagellar basal body protein, partial [Plasticicumulans sp.]
MADLLNTGLSSLRAAQLALSTAGHNIANVNTEGYSRQRATLETRLPQYVGEGFIGTGVNVATISRSFDKFLTQQVRSHTATQSQLDVQQGLTEQVDSLLSDGQASLAPLLQGVYDAMQAVAEAPAATAPRQTLLAQAQSLTDR